MIIVWYLGGFSCLRINLLHFSKKSIYYGFLELKVFLLESSSATAFWAQEPKSTNDSWRCPMTWHVAESCAPRLEPERARKVQGYCWWSYLISFSKIKKKTNKERNLTMRKSAEAFGFVPPPHPHGESSDFPLPGCYLATWRVFKRKPKVTFCTQWSRLKAILSVMPKTASVFRLLMVGAPAGLHLVETPPTGDSGGMFSPPVPICPCVRFFLSGCVHRINASVYLYQNASSYYLIFLRSKITKPSLLVFCDHWWSVLLFCFGKTN